MYLLLVLDLAKDTANPFAFEGQNHTSLPKNPVILEANFPSVQGENSPFLILDQQWLEASFRQISCHSGGFWKEWKTVGSHRNLGL